MVFFTVESNGSDLINLYPVSTSEKLILVKIQLHIKFMNLKQFLGDIGIDMNSIQSLEQSLKKME